MAVTVLGWLLLAEAVLLSMLTLAAVGVLGARRWDGRHDERLRVARDRVLEVLAGIGNPSAALSCVMVLPVRLRRRLLLELVPNVGPAERPILAELATSAGLVDRARQGIRSRRWRRRLAGMHVLTAIGVDDPHRPALLDDPVPAVRAAAAWWSSTVAPGRRCAASLAARADDPSGRVRHAVAESLAQLGPDGAEVVADLMLHASSRARRVALAAASGLHDPRVEAAARCLATHPDPALRASGCRLMSSADPASVAVLDRLVVDPDPGVRAAAAASLGAGRTDELVERLAPLVVDENDVVRVAAADALVQLGPVGRMVVRASAAATAGPAAGEVRS